MLCLVTGGTGFVGGHVAETLCQHGHQVRTIARSGSDTTLLKQWGVEIIEGDLTDPAVVQKACQQVECVIHCAAKVGEWGPIEEYRKVNVDALRHLLEAVRDKPLHRFVLVSSLGVYQARDHFGTDETAPLPERHIDSYTQTKVEADLLAQEFAKQHSLPLVILRPGFVYGPRDRTVMPRILKNLRFRLVTYFGSRKKVINQVYVGNVVEAVLLAMTEPKAVGQVYNIRDGRLVTKKEFFETIAELAELPKPLVTYPMWFARLLCGTFETLGKTFGFAPLLNGARLKFMGLNLDYSIEKARRELGYNPSTDFEEGIRKTIDWLRQEGKVGRPSASNNG